MWVEKGIIDLLRIYNRTEASSSRYNVMSGGEAKHRILVTMLNCGKALRYGGGE
jgi:hypothetical protein